jgi:1,4-alpha-glucan branching enzyme
MEKFTAEQAIEKIKSIKTNFMGHEVAKYEPIIIRAKLESMARANMISPAEYNKALNITWDMMSDGEKRKEFERLAK